MSIIKKFKLFESDSNDERYIDFQIIEDELTYILESHNLNMEYSKYANFYVLTFSRFTSVKSDTISFMKWDVAHKMINEYLQRIKSCIIIDKSDRSIESLSFIVLPRDKNYLNDSTPCDLRIFNYGENSFQVARVLSFLCNLPLSKQRRMMDELSQAIYHRGIDLNLNIPKCLAYAAKQSLDTIDANVSVIEKRI